MRRPVRVDAPALVAGGHGRDVIVDGILAGQNQLGAAVGQDHAALHGKRAALDQAGKASRQLEALLSDFEAFIMAQTRLLGAPSHTCASFRGLNPLRPSSPALAGDVCPVGEKPKAASYSADPGLNHENSHMVPEAGRMGPAEGGRQRQKRPKCPKTADGPSAEKRRPARPRQDDKRNTAPAKPGRRGGVAFDARRQNSAPSRLYLSCR